MTEVATRTRPNKPARPRTLSCPNCGGSIQVRANGISVSAICASCGSTVDVASPDVKLITQAQARTRTLELPIGTRGTLFGTEWEVIGYQLRRNNERGSWEEYLLFNPYRGFRFLVHDDEGWSLFCMLRHDVQPPPQDEEPVPSDVNTEYVLGEFYWRARAGDAAVVTEYEDGSRMLVCERSGDEIVWSNGVTVPDATVRKAFGLQQPAPDLRRETERARTMRVLRFSLLAIAALFLLHAVPFGRSRSLQVFQKSFTATASDRGRTVVTDPFEVPDAGGNLRIDIHTKLRNDWVELGVSLVREPGDLTFTGRSAIEHYSGYDSDGAWSEGGDDGSVTFRSVPGGTYRLLMDPDAGAFARAPAPRPVDKFGISTMPRPGGLAAGQGSAGQGTAAGADPSITFDVTVRRHVPAPELFWLALIILIPYPAYRLFFRRRSA